MKSTHKPDEAIVHSMKCQAVLFILVSALANGLAASQQVTPPLLGNRFLTFNTVVRVRQIEVTRDTAHGPDESSVHTPAEGLYLWLTEIRKRWPDARLITQGQFGELWRTQFKNNDEINYRFVHRGCGIRASEADKEIHWFMNKDFRLVLLRNWKENLPEKVIDFTRYDLPATEPGSHSRNWSLLGRINQKQTRPQDQPIPIAGLTEEERSLIRSHYPGRIESQ